MGLFNKPHYMNTMKIKALALIILLFHSAIINAQRDKINHEERNDILGWLSEYNVPAVGIGLINNGKLVDNKVFGELRKGIPAEDNSVFTIASVTKVVTTIVVLKLVETGHWDLDEPLCNYWVDPDVADDAENKSLTTRHVLSHQSGLPNWRSDLDSKKLEFLFHPGAKYNYSGEGFEYLRKAIENKLNRPFEEISYSVLFKPQNMLSTKFKWSNEQEKTRFAYRHTAEGEEFRNQGCMQASAASGLLTTMSDFSAFGIHVMNQADLSESLFNDMTSTQTNIKKDYDQGLGWQIVRNLPNDEYALVHEGGEWGVSTIAILLPESRNGIIVFTNGDRGDEVYSKVVKEYLDNGSEILRILSGKSYDPESIKTIEVSPDILSTYVGSYFIETFKISIDIILENKTLKLVSPYSTMVLFAESETEFFLKDDDFKIEVVHGANNSITGIMVIYQGGEPEFAMKSK